MLEVGNIGRFPKAGNYSSYCRCVESKKTSNGKKKGEKIRKTETGTWPGHMLRRQTMPFGAARKHRHFFNAKWPKANGLWLQKP